MRIQKRQASRGNALMEYAVPAMVILVTAGVIATVGGIDQILARYFMAASGHTQADLSGSTFRTKELGALGATSDDVGNGWEAMGSYGTLLNGSGSDLGASGSGIYFVGPVNRTGGRSASSSSEYLYPTTGG